MGRPIRRYNPNTLLHICNRGSRQEEIFSDPYDFNHCEQILHHAISQHSVSLLCYCLMPNHWHLLSVGPYQQKTPRPADDLPAAWIKIGLKNMPEGDPHNLFPSLQSTEKLIRVIKNSVSRLV